MASIIKLLPDHVANQIAAGEVVQRPASVVKELLENAIDAGADKIQLIVRDAGKTLIQVIDNGIGMNTEDAKMCFQRHATSKIDSAEDLFALKTKGFRGEALASIAAIAHVELKTRQEHSELGTCLRIEGGKIVDEQMVVTGQGTNIAVKNLFYNIPARRNFLKSNTVETRHIIDEFQRVALAHDNIAFSLHHNDNQIFQLEKRNLRKRIVDIFGNKSNEKLVPINEETDLINIRGFVGKPSFAKKKRGEQFFFVNDRFIKSSYLHHAILGAYDGLLDTGNHPAYFLYLEVKPETIDINIHPTKTEIKFENDKAIYAILRATVKHSLGQYNIAPVLDFQRDATLDTPYNFRKKTTSQPKITVDPNFNPFQKEFQEKKGLTAKKEVSYWESLYAEAEEQKLEEEDLFNSTSEIETGKTLQIQRKYVLSSIKSGLVLIHQRWAHQRILYESFLESITLREPDSQQLLFPVKVNLNTKELVLFNSIQNDLENAGFQFDAVAESSISIKGIPSSIEEAQIGLVIEELLENLQEDVPEESYSHFDIMAKSFASSLAIKTGVLLSMKEQEALVNNLFSCREPDRSPDGKPTFKTMTLQELDKIFTH